MNKKMNNRYSFADLFRKPVDYTKDEQVNVSCIVIPQIQRPYAQGRSDNVSTYVRKTFLDEIFLNLSDESDNIFDLNFIYGIIKPYNSEYRFELLDGQQRLTTLFLLYWYITNVELDFEQSSEIRGLLSKFLYETRATSTVFCQELAQYHTDFAGNKPSEVIRKAKWYFKSFDRDSTITAMLTMLDAIHERYIKLNRGNLLRQLQKLQFYVKSLGVYNLSEELYIKMNARGLQLSTFENFKADLTNFITKSTYEKFVEEVPLYKTDSSEKVPFNFNFSVKLDAKWVDVFWKNGSSDFDDAYMSFFSRYFACKYIIASKDKIIDKDMGKDAHLKFFYTEAEEQYGNNTYVGFKEYEELLKQHPEYIITLDKVLDVFYNYDCKCAEKLISRNFVPIWDKTEDTLFDDFYCNTSSKMSQVKLIAFAAVIEYIEAMPNFIPEDFERWMRVVWNVIENTNIDSLIPTSALIRKFSDIIHFVSQNMEDGFYSALSKWTLNSSSERENRAVLEEVEKARRIANDSVWEEVWPKAEKHPYFKGMVAFFYNPGMSIEDYEKNLFNAETMFDKDGISPTYRTKHLLIRAIVSQYSNWNDLNELYITERAEKDKHLKNILASNKKVRNMLTDVLSKSSEIEIKDCLYNYIQNAEELSWEGENETFKKQLLLASSRLRSDVKMYDWIAEREMIQKACFRVYWYWSYEFIMFAIPYKQYYDRIAIDTERAKLAQKLCENNEFSYENSYQEEMATKFGECFGNELWINKKMSKCKLWIGFISYHNVAIQIECNTKEYAQELLCKFEGSSYVEITPDEKLVQIPNELQHWTVECSYDKLYTTVNEVLKLLE